MAGMDWAAEKFVCVSLPNERFCPEMSVPVLAHPPNRRCCHMLWYAEFPNRHKKLLKIKNILVRDYAPEILFSIAVALQSKKISTTSFEIQIERKNKKKTWSGCELRIL